MRTLKTKHAGLRLAALCAAATLVALMLTACDPATPSGGVAPPPDVPTPNAAFAALGYSDVLTDDTLLAAVVYGYVEPERVGSAAQLDSYTDYAGGEVVLIVPRYAGSVVELHAVKYDEAKGEFVPDEPLYSAEAGDSYALRLETYLPEGGPTLQVSVTLGAETAIYHPSYDGRGEPEIYPYVYEGVLRDIAALPTVFTDGPGGERRVELLAGDEFLGLELIWAENSIHSVLAQFVGEVELYGVAEYIPEGDLMSGVLTFTVAESSLHLLPYPVQDTRDLWFGITNAAEAAAQLGIAPGESAPCSVVIDDYYINLYPSMVWNTATFVRVGAGD